MSSWGLIVRGVGFGALLSCAVACSVATDDTTSPEPTDDTEQSVHRDWACPQVSILCAEGYHVKYGPSCHQSCVPDKRDKSSCTPACGTGEYCAECKTVNGSGFFCMPEGSTC